MATLNQDLTEWINAGWGDYVNRADGNPMPYDEWFARELSLLGISPGTDVSNYTATGSAGDVQREFAVNSGDQQVYSKQWEDDPEWTAPYLALAGFALPALAVGAGLAGAGAAGSAAGAGGAGGLAAAETGLSALGSAWSPSALGITAVAPSVSAAEIAALSAALPGAVQAGAGAGGALSSLGSGMSPSALGIEAVAPGVTQAELASLSQALPSAPGLSPLVPGLPNLPEIPDIKPSTLPSIPDRVFPNIPSVPELSAPTNWLKDMLNPISNVVKPIADAVGGGSNLAGLIGAVAGGVSGGGTNTATTQSQIDPRMAQYLYGTGYGDKNSFLGAAQDFWQQNKSGLNSTMQQGLDMQRAALTDPAYGQAYQQMRGLGTGLMSQPVAGNPFTGGGLLGGPTSQAGGTGGLLGDYGDRAKALMNAGRGLFG